MKGPIVGVRWTFIHKLKKPDLNNTDLLSI